MNLADLVKIVDQLYDLTMEILRAMDERAAKGGPGSGCGGPNCGRPAGHDGEHRPRSGVRPSAVHPDRTEIVYQEQPSSDNRPRSGVRPSAVKPRR